MNDDYANPVVVAIVVVVVVVSVAAAVMVVFAVEHAVAQCSLSRRFLRPQFLFVYPNPNEKTKLCEIN